MSPPKERQTDPLAVGPLKVDQGSQAFVGELPMVFFLEAKNEFFPGAKTDMMSEKKT